MEGVFRSSATAPGDLTVEAVDAMRALEATGRDPIVLAYHPVARVNPFLALLYREAWDAGIAPIAMVREERIEELVALAALGYRIVLHLHWLNLPLRDATSTADAEQRVDVFLERLDGFLAAGGRIAWTVHNILSHASRFEAAEARMLAAVARRSTVIHVMAGGTRELVAPFYDIPADKVLHVPHPSYIGAYEDYVSRESARHELGLMPDEIVYLAAGAIRAYKGLPALLDAWDALPADPPRRLLIAGAPVTEPGIDEVIERAVLHPRVTVYPFRIPAERMQLFLRAADIAVLPYVRSLNSGALMLALTFGLPVIVPAGGGLAELVAPAYGLTFEPGPGDGLARAVTSAVDLVTPEARAAARAVAIAHDPVGLSRRFAEGLRRMLDADEAGAQRPGR